MRNHYFDEQRADDHISLEFITKITSNTNFLNLLKQWMVAMLCFSQLCTTIYLVYRIHWNHVRTHWNRWINFLIHHCCMLRTAVKAILWAICLHWAPITIVWTFLVNNYGKRDVFRQSHDIHIDSFEPFSIQGQNALTLATYSGDIDTCNVILSRIDFSEFNTNSLLSPLCVAVMQGNTEIAQVKNDMDLNAPNMNISLKFIHFIQIYLTLEPPNPNPFDCPSESIHGICPMRLAQLKGDNNMIDLLRPKHQLHLLEVSAIRWAINLINSPTNHHNGFEHQHQHQYQHKHDSRKFPSM